MDDMTGHDVEQRHQGIQAAHEQTRARGPRPTTYLAGADRDPFGPPVRSSAAELADLRRTGASVRDQPGDDLEGDDE